MPSISPEQLIQRISDAGLLDARQIESLWAELGTREVSLEQVTGLLLRKELLTNYQLDRLIEGREGRLLLRRLQGAVPGRHRHVCPRLSGRARAKTGRIVCVKALRKRFRDDKAMTEQFLREGKIGMQLRHPVHRADLRGAGAAVAVADHGVRRREQPARVPADAQEAGAAGIDAADRRYSGGPGVCVSARDDAPRPEDVERAGHQPRAGQAGGFRPGRVADATTRAASEETNPRTIDYAALERASNAQEQRPAERSLFRRRHALQHARRRLADRRSQGPHQPACRRAGSRTSSRSRSWSRACRAGWRRSSCGRWS